MRAVLRQRGDEVFRSLTSSLAPWLPRLEATWGAECHNANEIWRRLREAGFGGCLRTITEWAKRRQLSEQVNRGDTGSRHRRWSDRGWR